MSKLVLFAAVTIFLNGCASVADSQLSEQTGSIVVPPKARVCLVTPADGSFEGKSYRDSGMRVGQKIEKAIAEESYLVDVLPRNDDFVSDCRIRNAKYMVDPEILLYENRASGWTGMPDQIKVKVSLQSLDHPGEVSSFVYSADSNMAASFFFEWGNAAPYELLDSKFKETVQDLLAGKISG
ncbi:DUF4823 domain-containing protein [Shewanella marina]|uniref:DUF4823 domain-containing protein n=1 Tax=Shewanella marina TaxID=487319 RepID=UPI00046E64A1|nr:DUF4823 domain-containing protein [Shewanella marina]